ncbi:hypothetical protein E4H12_13935, partial [Candidatus Thorarchaeota archaeon]
MFDRKAYYQRTKERVKANSKKWKQANRTKVQQQTRDQYLRLKASDPARVLLGEVQRRAKRKGLNCTIIKEDIVIPSHCPVFGIELKRSCGKRSANSISLDSIDLKQGYTKENIVVVSWRVNHIKSNASFNELQQLVEFYNRY